LDRLVAEHEANHPPAEDDDPPPSDRDEPPDSPPDEPPSSPSSGESDEPTADGPTEVFEASAAPPLPLPVPPPAPTPFRPAQRLTPARASGSRGVESPIGRHVRSLAPRSRAGGPPRPLDLPATLRVAAPHQPARRTRRSDHGPRVWLEPGDVREKLRQARVGACILFVVDASGSMAARRRMAAAKGAVVSLLHAAYQRRDRVGLVAFRGPSADLLLPPTNSVDLGHARLRDLPTGGRTPLPAALRLAFDVLVLSAARARAERLAPVLVLVSDGRANVSLASGNPTAESLDLARALRAAGVTALVVDAEDGPVRLGLARSLGEALGGQYLRLADVAAPSGGALHPLARAALDARALALPGAR
jgi:magnesium chelatase subunit D